MAEKTSGGEGQSASLNTQTEEELVAKGVFPPEGLSREWEEIDNRFAERVTKQLNEHDLNPDGETFYLCDTGIGHGVRIAKELKKMGVSSSAIIDESTMGIVDRLRYQRSVKRWGRPEHIDNSRGEMIIIDGHASVDEKLAQPVINRLPDAVSLKVKGVKRVVLLAEAGLQGKSNSKESYYFKNGLPVTRYLNKLNNNGLEILAVGVDPRLSNLK